MATFNTAGLGGTTNASPSYTPSLQVNPNVTTVQFGDGYEQRLHKGLNVAPRVWKLAFKNRTDTDRDNFISFFESSSKGNNGKNSFDWTDPYGYVGKWVCQQWNVEQTSANNNNITTQFRQVFEV
tara:strand:+ start:673 stop:1047 length:375 start_codon:yes stop_codon:yes gene_type:complete